MDLCGAPAKLHNRPVRRSLRLSGNRLRDLPQSLVSLKLTELVLSDNRIGLMPSHIVRAPLLAGLKVLALQGNEIVDVSAARAVAGGGGRRP